MYTVYEFNGTIGPGVYVYRKLAGDTAPLMFNMWDDSWDFNSDRRRIELSSTTIRFQSESLDEVIEWLSDKYKNLAEGLLNTL